MKRREFLIHQILLLLAITPFLPAILGGDTLFGHDAQAQFQIWQGHAAREILSGTFPQWNPYIFTGTPLGANPQLAVFYPGNLLFLLTSPARAVLLFFILHAYLSLLGCYLFCRWQNLSSLPSLFAATIYGWGGFTLGQIAAGHLTIVASFPWIPLLLGAIERWSESRRPHWIMIGTLFAALLLLSGHPQTIYLGGLLAIAYGTRKIFLSSQRLSTTAGLIIMASIATLLVAVQWIPSAYFLSETGRGHAPAGSFQTEASLPPENLATYLIPDLFGGLDPNVNKDLHTTGLTKSIPTYSGRSSWWEVGTYFGVIPLLLIFLSLWPSNENRQPGGRFFTGVGILSLLLALGNATPFHQLAMKCLPGLSLFRVPARALLLAQLAVAFLVALNAERLMKNSPPIRSTLGSVCLMIWTALLLTWIPLQATDLGVNPVYHAHLVWTLAGTLGLLVASLLLFLALKRGLRPDICLILLLSLTTADLLARATPRLIAHDSQKDRWPNWLVDFLQTDQSPQERLLILNGYRLSDLNIPLTHRIHSVGGYDPAIPRSFHDVAHRSMRAGDHPLTVIAPHVLSPWLQAMSVSHILLPPGASLGNRFAKEYQIVPPPFPPVPRARLAHRVRVLEPQQILDRMKSEDWDPSQEILVDRAPPFALPEKGTDLPASPVRFILDRATEIQLECVTDRAGLLILSDTFVRGWTAEVDGITTPIVPVMHWARGVYITPGSHRIRFTYQTPGLHVGALFTLLGGVLWALGALGSFFSGKHRGS